MLSRSFSNHLAITNPQQDERQRLTHCGQANWADPATSHSCRECAYWDDAGDKQLGRDAHGVLKPRRCEKYLQLMNGRRGDRVPHSAKACRFFDELPDPPAAQQRRPRSW